VVRHIFQACPVWIYTQSNITSINMHVLLKTNNILYGTKLHFASIFIYTKNLKENIYEFLRFIIIALFCTKTPRLFTCFFHKTKQLFRFLTCEHNCFIIVTCLSIHCNFSCRSSEGQTSTALLE
jgi:hypothetical protein